MPTNSMRKPGHVTGKQDRAVRSGKRDRRARSCQQCDPALNKNDGRRLGTVVVNIDINYRRECFSGDRLSVVTRAHARGRKSYVLHQEIHAIDGQCVSDAKVTSVVMDMGTREVAALPEKLASQFEEIRNRETS